MIDGSALVEIGAHHDELTLQLLEVAGAETATKHGFATFSPGKARQGQAIIAEGIALHEFFEYPGVHVRRTGSGRVERRDSAPILGTRHPVHLNA